tara:strand:- start:241 stop:1116 length:876 start_codon:yes stop_codon:yes gene_type:complete
MEKITDILQEKAEGILTEDTLQAIENAFNNKVKLHVESALVKQDDEYSTKLEHLLEAIDIDHTKKLDKVIEAIDKNHGDKLISVVKKYSHAINEEATTFKKDLVNKVSKFLDLYLEKLVPQRSINEAVKNRKSNRMISELRKVLAVDAALQKDSIKEAIVDGKARIDESTERLDEATAKVEELALENRKLKSMLTLENKVNNLPEDKANFCRRVLGKKSAKFITENFDYTLKMFDKNHEEHLEVLHEQARKQNTVTKDVDRPVLNESAEEPQSDFADHAPLGAYMGELGKY